MSSLYFLVVIDIIKSDSYLSGSLSRKNRKIEPVKTGLFPLLFLRLLLWANGYWASLTVNIESFAVAGAIILFMLALEMIFVSILQG